MRVRLDDIPKSLTVDYDEIHETRTSADWIVRVTHGGSEAFDRQHDLELAKTQVPGVRSTEPPRDYRRLACVRSLDGLLNKEVVPGFRTRNS